MNKPAISVTTLLERAEYEIETANGRTARVCRDERGDFWVVDGAERVVSLYDFADECQVAARMIRSQEVRAAGRGIATGVKEAFARIAKGLQRPGAKAAHA
jgi:alkylation response protein AidB-like acyl-CoA dehydrogenase